MAQKKPCPKYDEMLKNLYENPPADVIEMMRKNEELFKMLRKSTRLNITTITDVELLYNTLLVERDAQLELPDWTEKVFPDKMLPIAKRSLALFTETQFMKRTYTYLKGPFLKIRAIVSHCIGECGRFVCRTTDRGRIFLMTGNRILTICERY